MESNFKDDTPIIQKATLRDEFGYTVAPRTISSAITIDDLEITEMLQEERNRNRSDIVNYIEDGIIVKPITLNDALSHYANNTYKVDNLMAEMITKSDKNHTHSQYVTNAEVSKIVLDRFTELQNGSFDLDIVFDKKVDKVEGKQLSTNDFTNEYKAKLDKQLTVDDIQETEEKLFMSPIERLKLARLDNGGKFNISYYDLLDKPDFATEEYVINKISEAALGNIEKYVLKEELDLTITRIDALIGQKADKDHIHGQYINEAQARSIAVEENNALENRFDSKLSPYAKLDTVSNLISDLSLNKADKDHTHEEYTTVAEVTTIIDDRIGNFDPDILDIDLSNYATKTELNNKVDKITGKGLSTNDFTNEYKTKLDSLEPLPETIEASKITGITASMVSGLARVSRTGSYSDLLDKPEILTEDEIKVLIAQAQLGGDGSSIDLSAFQTKTSNELNTTSKTIVGAINELKNLLANSTDIEDINHRLDQIQSAVDSLQANRTELESRITLLENNNSVLTNKVSSLQLNMESVLARLSALESGSDGGTNDETVLNTRVTSLETRMNQFKLNTSDTLLIESEISVSALSDTTRTTLTERITALEEEMTIQETYSFALIEDEAYTGFTVYTLPENPTLSDRVANLESRMTQLENLNYVLVESGEEGDYAAQLTALETRTSTLEALNVVCVNNASSVSTLSTTDESRIDSLNNRVAALESLNYALLSGNLLLTDSSNFSSMTTLEKIQNLNTRITNLEALNVVLYK